MSKEELQQLKKQVSPDGWDDGRIAAFFSSAKTNSYSIKLRGGGKILFVTQDDAVPQSETVFSEVDSIFTWLGVPSGFTLILFWIDAPRVLERDAWPTKTNVNGGWTIPGSNEIVVYRSEEWDRVLIHETIHALKWDWDMPTKPLKCWGLSDNAQLMPHLFEAWTELYAEWLWCGWHNVSWITQMRWMHMQATQIFARLGDRDWSENTNVFSYYILKTALAPHVGFLWTFRNGMSSDERMYVLCSLASRGIQKIKNDSIGVVPSKISLRMTFKK